MAKKKMSREERAEYKNGKYTGGPAEEKAKMKKKKMKRMAFGGPVIMDGNPGDMLPRPSFTVGEPSPNGRPAPTAGRTNAAAGGGRGAGLPPGLAKRGPGNLPPGLKNMAQLPQGLRSQAQPIVGSTMPVPGFPSKPSMPTGTSVNSALLGSLGGMNLTGGIGLGDQAAMAEQRKRAGISDPIAQLQSIPPRTMKAGGVVKRMDDGGKVEASRKGMRNENAAAGGGRGTGLPPGLAKRGPGNLPPGLAKRKTLPPGLTGIRGEPKAPDVPKLPDNPKLPMSAPAPAVTPTVGRSAGPWAEMMKKQFGAGMKGGGLARKGVGVALAKGGMVRANGKAQRGKTRGKMC